MRMMSVVVLMAISSLYFVVLLYQLRTIQVNARFASFTAPSS